MRVIKGDSKGVAAQCNPSIMIRKELLNFPLRSRTIASVSYPAVSSGRHSVILTHVEQGHLLSQAIKGKRKHCVTKLLNKLEHPLEPIMH